MLGELQAGRLEALAPGVPVGVRYGGRGGDDLAYRRSHRLCDHPYLTSALLPSLSSGRLRQNSYIPGELDAVLARTMLGGVLDAYKRESRKRRRERKRRVVRAR